MTEKSIHEMSLQELVQEGFVEVTPKEYVVDDVVYIKINTPLVIHIDKDTFGVRVEEYDFFPEIFGRPLVPLEEIEKKIKELVRELNEKGETDEYLLALLLYTKRVVREWVQVLKEKTKEQF